MPHYWIRISTDTPKNLKGLPDPDAFDAKLRQIVRACNGTIVGTFYAADAKIAYALVDDNGGQLDRDKLDDELQDAKTLRTDLQVVQERKNHPWP